MREPEDICLGCAVPIFDALDVATGHCVACVLDDMARRIMPRRSHDTIGDSDGDDGA